MSPMFAQSDATSLPLADDAVQLIVTSPPYMDARTYGIGAQRDCEDWIDFMLKVVRELVRVCTGAVIVNCGGVTRDRCYWPDMGHWIDSPSYFFLERDRSVARGSSRSRRFTSDIFTRSAARSAVSGVSGASETIGSSPRLRRRLDGSEFAIKDHTEIGTDSVYYKCASTSPAIQPAGVEPAWSKPVKLYAPAPSKDAAYTVSPWLDASEERSDLGVTPRQGVESCRTRLARFVPCFLHQQQTSVRSPERDGATYSLVSFLRSKNLNVLCQLFPRGHRKLVARLKTNDLIPDLKTPHIHVGWRDAGLIGHTGLWWRRKRCLRGKAWCWCRHSTNFSTVRAVKRSLEPQKTRTINDAGGLKRVQEHRCHARLPSRTDLEFSTQDILDCVGCRKFSAVKPVDKLAKDLRCFQHHQLGPKPINPNKREHSKRLANGDMEYQVYIPPALANPGNLVSIKVGGGLLGHSAAHDNEAPFPERIPEFFIRSHSRPGDIVLDPFSGSGTTAAVATKLGRIGLGLDLRFNQCELGRRRCDGAQRELIFAKGGAD